MFQMASQLLDYKLDSLPNCSVFRNYLAIRLDPEISRSLKYIQCSFAWWLLGCKCLLEFSNVLTATWFTYIHAYILEILYIYIFALNAKSQVNRLHKQHLKSTFKTTKRLIRNDNGLEFKDTSYECSSDSELDDVLETVRSINWSPFRNISNKKGPP